MSKLEEIAIKYRKQKIGPDLFLLIPEELIEGYSVFPIFYSNQEYKMLQGKESIENNEFIVDGAYNVAGLCEVYEFDDPEFVKSYFYEEEKELVIIVDTSTPQIRKSKLNISAFKSQNFEETYRMLQSQPSVVLNEPLVTQLLSLEDIESIRKELNRFKKSIEKFGERNTDDCLTQISVKNGHVAEINIDKNIVGAGMSEDNDVRTFNINLNRETQDPKSISVTGLEKYINERVFGHPDEIKKIATILVMNLRATREDGTESILIPGPTGTGKTATIEAASEYLGVPFKTVDTSNLVAQGIKGQSIEDELLSLYIKANNDRELAEKGIIAFDEFDKLSQTDLDIKGPVKNILLKFIEGSTYRIERLKGDIEIDTRLLSKMFLGAFEELFASDKTIGFGNNPGLNARREFDINRMYEKEIYNKELISRIPHIIPYYELTDEVKRDIILRSKLSKYLMKKRRYEREFGVEMIADESYIDALISALKEKDRSIRDLNNLILKSLGEIEYELLAQEGHVKRLVLTAETVENPQKYNLS